ncbi:MAG: hypothetical protein U0935_02750 [Pirellulales bacterium]
MTRLFYRLILLFPVLLLCWLAAPDLVQFVSPPAAGSPSASSPSEVADQVERMRTEAAARAKVLDQWREQLFAGTPPASLPGDLTATGLPQVIERWQRNAQEQQWLEQFVQLEHASARPFPGAEEAEQFQKEATQLHETLAGSPLADLPLVPERFKAWQQQAADYLVNAPKVAQVDKLLAEAKAAAKIGDSARLAQLEDEFRAAVEQLGEARELVADRIPVAMALWKTIGFRQRAETFLRRTFEVVKDGKPDAGPLLDGLIQGMETQLKLFEAELPGVDAALRERVHLRIQSLKKKPAAPQTNRVLVLVVATRDIWELREEVVPALEGSLARHRDCLMLDSLFLVQRHARPRRWTGKAGEFLLGAPPPPEDPQLFSDADPLPLVTASCDAALEDIATAARCLPRHTLVFWPFRAAPSQFATTKDATRAFPVSQVALAWIGSEMRRSAELEKWVGEENLQSFGSGKSRDLLEWLSFQFRGCAR